MQRQMSGHVHAVMQDTKDVDLVLGAVNPENHQMSASPALSGHVQGVNIGPNFVAQFAAHHLWASA
jgi:hypothetical protein